MAERAFQIVILGATGNVGRSVSEFFVRNSIDDVVLVSRNQQKLNELEANLQEITRKRLSLQKITADVNDAPNLNELCENSRLIINCLPSKQLCEKILNVCIETQTLYIDSYSELNWLQESSNFIERAVANNTTCIVGAGMITLPLELAILHGVQVLSPGPLISVEHTIHWKHTSSLLEVSGSTWKSIADQFSTSPLIHPFNFRRKELQGQFSLPTGIYFDQRLKTYLIETKNDVNSFVSSNLCNLINENPYFQTRQYYSAPSQFLLCWFILLFMIFGILCKLSITLKVIKQVTNLHHSFFGSGEDSPSPFTAKVIISGHSSSYVPSSGENKPQRELILKVKFPKVANGIYSCAGFSIGCTALALLKQNNNISGVGSAGVMIGNDLLIQAKELGARILLIPSMR